jgi:uncharacterized protein (TIGR02246 family)
MKRFGSILLALAAVTLTTRPIRADDAGDKEAIARNGEAFIAAVHKGDGAALAAFWVPDGDYTTQTGRHLKGRAAIEQALTAMFAEHKGLKIQVESETLRFVTPDVAIEDGVATVVPADGSLPTDSRFTNVHIKKDGQWLLSSARDSADAPPTNFEHLRGLAWAMGEWAAEDAQGATEHLTLSWAGNHNFILGSFASKVKGATVGSATHWIGWDPAGKRVRSWVFEGDARKIPHSITAIFQWDETFDVGSDTGTPVDDKDYQCPFVFTGKLETLTVILGPSPLMPAEKKAVETKVGQRD